jgi:hypothetical protein
MRHNADLSRAGCRENKNSGEHPLLKLYLTMGEMARRLALYRRVGTTRR